MLFWSLFHWVCQECAAPISTGKVVSGIVVAVVPIAEGTLAIVQGAVCVPRSKELWQGLPKASTRGVATFVRNIIGTLVVIQGADILEQGVEDDNVGPAAGPVTAALS
jgi:hypothetical protein